MLVDPEAAIPEARSHAPATGIITLEPPVASEALFALVNTFFAAFAKRSPESINELMVNDLVPLDTRRTRGEIVTDWQARNRRLDYTAIRGLDIVRIERMERFGYDDLGPTSSPPRPEDMQPGDLLVRLPVVAPIDQKTGEKLFRDVLLMLVRPVDQKLRIAGIGEVDTP